MSSRLKRDDDARRAVIADIMVRLFAMDIEGCRNDDIRFEQGVFGKPRLQDMKEPWDYNISHSGKWVTGIIGRRGQRVGIDVQKIEEVNSLLSRYTMSTDEMNKYHSLPPKEQQQYFYELWTRKESYYKMEGIGNRTPVQSLFSGENSVFYKQYVIDSGYKLTACSTDFRFPEECLVVRAADLAQVFLRRCKEQAQHSLSY